MELKAAESQSQEAESGECWSSVHFHLFVQPGTSAQEMVLSALRVGLSPSIYLAQELHHRQHRMFVSMAIIKPIKSRLKINHYISHVQSLTGFNLWLYKSPEKGKLVKNLTLISEYSGTKLTTETSNICIYFPVPVSPLPNPPAKNM